MRNRGGCRVVITSPGATYEIKTFNINKLATSFFLGGGLEDFLYPLRLTYTRSANVKRDRSKTVVACAVGWMHPHPPPTPDPDPTPLLMPFFFYSSVRPSVCLSSPFVKHCRPSISNYFPFITFRWLSMQKFPFKAVFKNIVILKEFC